ncbi:hypothetical protein RT94_08510 [Pseudomonas viridiflava]|nr:hypothetical protein RT94_08510 [Pseudomonas viridiflava]
MRKAFRKIESALMTTESAARTAIEKQRKGKSGGEILLAFDVNDTPNSVSFRIGTIHRSCG